MLKKKKNGIDGIGFALKKNYFTKSVEYGLERHKSTTREENFTGIQNVDYGHLDQRDV